MKPSTYIFLLFCNLLSITSFAQREFIRLSSQINHPANNNYFPYISGDGLTMIFSTDYTDYGGLSMFESDKKSGLWKKGVEMARLVNRPDLNFEGGYSLNFDGTFLIITSRKHGLGGYELWYSEKKNGNWTETRNFGAPVNSASNEGSGVLSPDEQEMYFMRCQQMDEQNASGCKLYFTQRKNGRWLEPVALPENVNKYNPQMPRILSDGETLIFSSKEAGGKGGFDFYQTRKTTSGWTDPVNMEFANTPGDEKYASVPARGRYLYVSRKGERKHEIVQLLFPDHLKPKSVYKVTGKVSLGSETEGGMEGIIFDAVNRKTFSRFPVDKTGNFAISLPEGTTYDVSFTPKGPGYWYSSKLYVLDSVPSRNQENIKVTLKPIEPDKPLINKSLMFNPYTSDLADVSSFELRRLASLLHAHPEYDIEVISHLYNYKEDSIQSNPDLTEVRVDTVYEKLTSFVPELYMNISVKDTVWLDSLTTNGTVIANEEDTLIILVDSDSLHLQTLNEKATIPAEQEVIVTSYHNDRTQKEAEAIKAALVARGIEEDRIITKYIVHKGDPSSETNREVELILRKK